MGFSSLIYNNFASLGLTRLVSTHYQHESEPSYALIYEGGDDFNMECGKVVTIYGNDDYTAGDFRSSECLKYLDECDITITNPPFDIFKEYMAVLIEHGKDFLVLGNQNAVSKLLLNIFFFNEFSYILIQFPDHDIEGLHDLAHFILRLKCDSDMHVSFCDLMHFP